MREVTVEVMEAWWTRPGAPSVPRTYVGALAKLQGEWVEVNGNVFEVRDGVIHPDRTADAETWALDLGEAPKAAVVSLLSGTEPDPRGRRHRSFVGPFGAGGDRLVQT